MTTTTAAVPSVLVMNNSATTANPAATAAPPASAHLGLSPASQRFYQFYPGLAAFTDAIDALPQETIRHFTLLREVDAKACGPEELLRRYIDHALYLPPPANPTGLDAGLELLRRCEEDQRVREEALLKGDVSLPPAVTAELDEDPAQDHSRRSRLHQVRLLISDLLQTLDEKIHVISTASEALNKHLIRLDDAYAVINQEISVVIRDGNPHHWAYRLSLPKGGLGQKHTGPHVNVDSPLSELTNLRTENRRENNNRRNAPTSDAADPRAAHYASGTASIPVTSTHDGPLAPPASKRRKGAGQSANQTSSAAIERGSFTKLPPVIAAVQLGPASPPHPTKRGTTGGTANSASKPQSNRKR